MARATWNGTLLAESDATVIIEGNHYFPNEAIHWDHFEKSDTQSVCPWKGTASYYNVKSGAGVNKDAAWGYPEPKPEAAEIAGHIAFWKGVQIED